MKTRPLGCHTLVGFQRVLAFAHLWSRAGTISDNWAAFKVDFSR